MHMTRDSVRDIGFSFLSLKREITQLACLLCLQKHPWCGLWWLQLRPFWRRGAVGILLCTCLQDKINIPLNNLRRVGKSLGVGSRGRRECENAAVVVVVFLGGLANIGQVLIFSMPKCLVSSSAHAYMLSIGPS